MRLLPLLVCLSFTVLPAIAQKPLRSAGKLDSKIFESAPATMAPDIFGDRQKKTGTLRVLTVDERMGYARTNELVRVPLFFHDGECSEPNAVQIVPEGGGAAIPFQADDIRRDAAGKIARMHAYFILDSLPAWGRKQFNVVPGKNPGATLPPLPIAESDGKITLASDALKLTFQTKADLAGAIAAIETSAGKVTIPAANLAPSANLIRQEFSGGKTLKENAFTYAEPDGFIVKQLSWASGPIFSKLQLRIATRNAPADLAEYIFIVPKFGNEFSQSERLYPEGTDTREVVGATKNALLSGKIVLGDSEADQQLVAIPAGLRKETRTVFKYTNPALVNAKSGISLSMVPHVQTGGQIAAGENGVTLFNGSAEFQTRNGSNSNGLRSWWGEAHYIFSKATDVEALWQQQCRAFQPLTAVVDEPWATTEDVWTIATQVTHQFWDIKNWGRSFEANLVMNYMDGKDVSKTLAPAEGTANAKPDLRATMPTQEAIATAWKGGQGASPVDPYNLTYSTTAIVPFSAYIQPSAKLDAMAWQLAQTSRLANGQTFAEGWPNIRSFANTANMKIGTYLCALWAGAKLNDDDLLRWGRDSALSQNLTATYGHGQRPYNSSVGVAEFSDVLYISITDFCLRMMELTGNEDLSIHPSVYGRYSDMIDVNADIYQRKFVQDKTTKEFATTSTPTLSRATFLRGQAHDHRWELFGCDPFLGLLGRASDGGKVGVTEACYYMQKEVGRDQTWNRLMTDEFYPAVMAAKALGGYKPAPRPALPANLQIATSGTEATLSWNAVPDAAGYRIYRAPQISGPWTWLNSPYSKVPPFTPPSAADKATAQAAAAADDESKAKALGIDIKKLKMADKTPAWTKLPPIVVPTLPQTLVKATTFKDAQAPAGSVYFVTAEDAAGRESRWYPNEPLPVTSK